MRHTTSSLLSLFLVCFLYLPIGAQTLPVHTPSGILLDRVLPMSRIEQLDGSDKSTAATPARWRQVIHELRRAAEQDLGWPEGRDLQTRVRYQGHKTQIPLSLVHARYDRVVASRTAPVARTVFMLSPLVQTTYYGSQVEFVLPTEAILEQGVESPIRLRMDCDDGQGWQVLVPNQSLTTSYADVGRKTLRWTADFADGRTLQATAVLMVARLATPEPTMTWPITASEAWQGAAGSGQAYVYLAPGHTELTNPVVVVEGFDIDNSMDWPVLYELLNQENLLEDLRTQGYDAVVLDFTDAGEPIPRNALVLTELLAQVRAAVSEDQSMVVVGASMGGLVARFALAWIEDQGLDHQVRTYISFDAPHDGANIPLGLQHWLRFFQGESTDAAHLLSRLNTPAARQLLLYHHTATTGQTAGADPQRAAFLSDLDNIGDWPQQLTLAGLANGSGLSANQGYSAGDQLIRYEYRSLLVDINGNVWAVPDGGTSVIFDGMLNVIWPLPDTYETITISGTIGWDNAPGGWRASMAQMDTTAVPYGDIVSLHDRHCFIPTVSAIALGVDDPFYPILNTPNLPDSTPFDTVFVPESNEEHIHVSALNKLWLLEQIDQGATAVGDNLPEVRGLTLSAYPNPFNPAVTLQYNLPHTDIVDLQVYDLTGKKVRTLIRSETQNQGPQTVRWNGRDTNGRLVAAGVYVCRIQTGDHARALNVVLVK